ncbi:MAG TPA: QacE family quaternary ammonium compound efflux SMR transporter [Rhizobium sp.]|nr:QacE family quaternary ammonium compound efflux SMR transporter [Rhizobium sp.]
MNPVVLAYGSLAGAIVCEVAGTALLQHSAQFTKAGPTAAMVGLYIVSFYLLSQALKGVPLGVAYAMWGGLGIILTAIISVTVFKQTLDLAALIGIGMIVAGVIVMNTFSSSVSHG